MRSIIVCLTAAALFVAPTAWAKGDSKHRSSHSASHCSNGKSTDAAMWYSILHPGVGEWYLKGFGSFNANAPQKKFWLGFIPGYGWPGYLQVKSAVDSKNCRTNDDLSARRDVRSSRSHS
jgi:hypothetical protein